MYIGINTRMGSGGFYRGSGRRKAPNTVARAAILSAGFSTETTQPWACPAAFFYRLVILCALVDPVGDELDFVVGKRGAPTVSPGFFMVRRHPDFRVSFAGNNPV